MLIYSTVSISMGLMSSDSIHRRQPSLIIAVLEFNLTVDMLHAHLAPFHFVSLALCCDFYTTWWISFSVTFSSSPKLQAFVETVVCKQVNSRVLGICHFCKSRSFAAFLLWLQETTKFIRCSNKNCMLVEKFRCPLRSSLLKQRLFISWDRWCLS